MTFVVYVLGYLFLSMLLAVFIGKCIELGDR